MNKPYVYFYCRNEEGNLQEDVITLAEGLRELGIPFSGNCDYWLESTVAGDYLIRHDPEIRADDADVVVVSYTWPFWIRMKTFDLVRRPLPEGLFKTGHRYRTVYMTWFQITNYFPALPSTTLASLASKSIAEAVI